MLSYTYFREMLAARQDCKCCQTVINMLSVYNNIYKYIVLLREPRQRSRYRDWLPFLNIVQTCSGAYLASYPMGTGSPSPGVKQQGRETDHSPPATAAVKKTWIYTPTPPYAFMV
jgi:hypothetical protein